MNAFKVSAQFAAYTLHLVHAQQPAQPTTEAMLFARDNWAAFLPCAHEGLGRLLLRIARPSQKRRGRKPGRTRSLRLHETLDAKQLRAIMEDTRAVSTGPL